MKTLKYLFFPLILAYACQPSIRTEELSVSCMGIGYLYDADTVNRYLQLKDENAIKLERSYLKEARAYSDKDYLRSNRAYKRAIALHPSKENYLEFAAALEKQKNERELLRLYRFLCEPNVIESESDDLGFLFGPPDLNIYISWVVHELNNGTGDRYSPVYVADILNLNQTEVKEKLLSDPRLMTERKGMDVRNFLFNIMTEEERNEYLTSTDFFKLFLESIPGLSDSFATDPEAITDFDYGNDPDDEMEGMLNLEHDFSTLLPTTWKNYYDFNLKQVYLMGLPENVAVIYALDSSRIGATPETRHITYYLAIFNEENGKVQSAHPIAWQSGEELVTCRLNGRWLYRNHYRRNWKNPYQKNVSGNVLLNTELLKSDSFLMDEFWLSEPPAVSSGKDG